MRATASPFVATAARPYTVSVGMAMMSPARRSATARSRAVSVGRIWVTAGIPSDDACLLLAWGRGKCRRVTPSLISLVIRMFKTAQQRQTAFRSGRKDDGDTLGIHAN